MESRGWIWTTYQEQRRNWMIENQAFLIVESFGSLQGSKKSCTRPQPQPSSSTWALMSPTETMKCAWSPKHMDVTEVKPQGKRWKRKWGLWMN